MIARNRREDVQQKKNGHVPIFLSLPPEPCCAHYGGKSRLRCVTDCPETASISPPCSHKNQFIAMESDAVCCVRRHGGFNKPLHYTRYTGCPQCKYPYAAAGGVWEAATSGAKTPRSS
ncbi:hypothetical protein [Noviherbaspirillum pedocola]|uniref:Uncharacterized protein n=1 Tax=Noviherbaspirillum pedocola TaxID=2801341 RepID=A0A934SWD8_9BURK|nr:hypothetical protein [Noviherbaspirillum pedocola]MBK4736987.1 hypothetical protein [Noviherbaspirillum pedocola]